LKSIPKNIQLDTTQFLCKIPLVYCFWANEEAFKLEAGMQGEIMDLPLVLEANLTESWLKHLWLQRAGLWIRVYTDIPNFAAPQTGNAYQNNEAVFTTWCP